MMESLVQVINNPLPMLWLVVGGNFVAQAAMVQSKRMATVIAEVDSLLISIKRWNFKSFVNLMPSLHESVMRLLKEHIILKYVKTGNPLFNNMGNLDQARLMIADLCELVWIPAETTILKEADLASAFFFVVEGDVDMRSTLRPKKSYILHEGSHVGDDALILNIPEPYTVVTLTSCLFLTFSVESFGQYLEMQPHVHAALEIRARGGATPLHRFLQYPPARNAFKQHLYDEFSAENLNFYMAVSAYEKLIPPDGIDPIQFQQTKILELYRQYVDPSGLTPINVPQATRDFITHDIVNGRLHREIFDRAKKEIYKLMLSDNYPRFKVS